MLTYATTIPTDIKTHNSPDVWCERYGAIVADPPWTFETYSERGKGRSAERHYRCMTELDGGWVVCWHFAVRRWGHGESSVPFAGFGQRFRQLLDKQGHLTTKDPCNRIWCQQR